MCAKGMLIGRDAKLQQGSVSGRRKQGEFSGRIDACEEYLRVPFVRKEANAIDRNDWWPTRGQPSFDFGQTLLWPFADKFCGDMQIPGRAPSQARDGLQFRDQGLQFLVDGGFKIECREQTHNGRVNAILPRCFYERPAAEVARALLGQLLVHGETAGVIVETEAYLGNEDLASHSARGITPRTAVIFGPPGHAYIYLNYGLHDCLNLIAEPEGKPGCVLLRAIVPERGLEVMRSRRGGVKERDLANGPGKLTRALGITRELNGTDVTQGALHVERRPAVDAARIVTTPRIGITKCADWPLRFVLG